MPTFKLTIAYDGTDFVGWQRQANGTSIQGLLEEAFAELDGRKVNVTGAGRTDAGVHATRQVAAATIERTLDAASVVRAINTRLPPSVRVREALEVPATFQARFHVKAKTYRYRIWNGEVVSPFERAYVWHVSSPSLDVAAMAAAAAIIEGRHDFAAFQATGGDTATTERTVFSSTCRAGLQTCPEVITYEIRGGGFLRHMVRNIVGTLVEVGRGSRRVDWMTEVLASRSRAAAGPTAPPEGLFLVGVEYE